MRGTVAIERTYLIAERQDEHGCLRCPADWMIARTVRDA
jgi:hypothetical protein